MQIIRGGGGPLISGCIPRKEKLRDFDPRLDSCVQRVCVCVCIYIRATVILANNIFHFGFGFCPGRNAAVARYHFFPPLSLSLSLSFRCIRFFFSASFRANFLSLGIIFRKFLSYKFLSIFLCCVRVKVCLIRSVESFDVSLWI